MSENTDTKISMSIDLKKNRLRVHSQTLKLLGSPEFVQLLISPSKRAIIVQAKSERETGGQEIPVVFGKPPQGCFEIYSKELICRIRKHFPVLDKKGLYRLDGSYMEENESVCFPLSTLRGPEEEHV